MNECIKDDSIQIYGQASHGYANPFFFKKSV